MIRIKRNLLETILEVSRNVYPEEFVGLLRKNKRGDISTLLVIPNSMYGDGFSGIREDMLPMGLGHCGSVHSHPGRSFRPSIGDLNFFPRMGEVHLIVAYPYTPSAVGVYDALGRRLEFKVVK